MTHTTSSAQRAAQLLLLHAVTVYTVVGLAAGLFYRDLQHRRRADDSHAGLARDTAGAGS
ncbi:hypothetical protein [Microbacterium sp.]|uniref:hypothetical protein n=1 Tax=Microbacterium sp. TaxID=51671 RepID=UPI00262655F4|nr:hypothetical protein [Microbacterium sp.]